MCHMLFLCFLKMDVKYLQANPDRHKPSHNGRISSFNINKECKDCVSDISKIFVAGFLDLDVFGD